MATELSGLSIYTITSDGITVEYPLQFASGTLRLSYVRVAVEGEVDGKGNQLYRTFTQVPGDPGMIRIEGTVPAAGLNITFQRIIPKGDLLHKYSNGAILDYPSLDESHLQLLMAIQELMDGFGFQNISTDLNMNNRNILNVGKLTLQDFSTGVGPSFQGMLNSASAALTAADTQMQLYITQVATQVNAATIAAGAAATSAASASTSAAEAAAGALLVDPRMDAVEQDVTKFKTDVDNQLTHVDDQLDAHALALAGKANADFSNVTGNAIGFYFHARDVKPAGTTGGSASANTWQTRDLNTVIRNTIGASLSGNQVTVPAGTYRVIARVPGAAVNRFRAALYNVATGAYLRLSSNGYSDYSYPTHCYVYIDDVITLLTGTNLELRMFCQVAWAHGMGYATNFNLQEQYSELILCRM